MIPWNLLDLDKALRAGWATDTCSADDQADCNEPLVYRKCTACGSRTPDLPERHVPDKWTPRQTYVWRGRGRYTEPIDPGPYPADSLASSNCDP
ncbi:hypothetical protein ACH4VR_29450 [Streptomyces sp. NPDC020883]|uniref:hypothetical protein n=1 Tax=Streptomyces sp. NPDC020883 TaxID=3365099 RepID=UPI00379572F0